MTTSVLPSIAVAVPSYGRWPSWAPARMVARGARRGALVWSGVFALVTWLEATQFAKEYPTAADRARLVVTMGENVGLNAIFGPSPRIDTVGGYVAAHAIGVLGIIGAVWGVLAGTRLLRGEEDAGRWESLLAGRTTRRRAVAMELAGLGLGWATLWTLTSIATVVISATTDAGFTVTSSLFLVTAETAAAAVFLAVGAFCSQLAGNRRQAVTWAAAILGADYLLRVVAYASTTLHWLRWATPLGWVDELRPLTGSKPLLLIPLLLTTLALAVGTILLGGWRDLGAGVLAQTSARPSRTRSLTGPVALAHRLGRGSMYAWLVGLAVGGLLIGLIAKGTEEIWANQSSGLFVELVGTTGSELFLGIGFLLVTFLVTMAAAGQVMSAREDEAEGYLDHLLSRPIGRLRWLSGRIAVSAGHLLVFALSAGVFTWLGATITGAGLGLPTLLLAALNTVPAGLVVLGLGILTFGVAPRLTSAVVYGVVAWSFLVELIGSSLGASRWVLDLSVLHHIARAPAESVKWGSAAFLVAVGLVTAAVGVARFTRRDLQSA